MLRLEGIVPEDLLAHTDPQAADELSMGLDVETVGRRLNWKLQSARLTRADGLASIKGEPSPYWAQVKREVWKAICTQDERYAELRRRFGEVKGKAAAPLLTSLSALIGSAIGAAAAIVLPLCALALYAALTIGIGAYCCLPPEGTSEAI